MDVQAFEKYRTGRLQQMLNFYDARSVTNKKWYRALSTYMIVASAGLAPLVAFAPAEVCWRIGEALASSSLVAVTALLSHFKFQENWLSYRAHWDALKREEQFHDAGIKDYDGHDNPHGLFVDKVESILAREAGEFYARNEKVDHQQAQRKRRTTNKPPPT